MPAPMTSVPRHLEQLPTRIPSWNPFFNECRAVASMPTGRPSYGSTTDPAERTLTTVRDFIQEVTYSTYHWRSSDANQVRVFQDARRPSDFYIGIAGSTPGFGPDLNSLFENLASQANAFPHAGYVEFVRQSLLDALRRIVTPNSRVFLTGHSQGGNVAQIVAAGMWNPPPGSSGPAWWADGDWAEVRSVMTARRIELAGVVAVASRPMGSMARFNLDRDGRSHMVLFVQSLDDVVPTLASPSTVTTPGAHIAKNSWDVVSGVTSLFGALTYVLPVSSIWQNIQNRRSDDLLSRLLASIQGRDIVTTRSQIVFIGNGDTHAAPSTPAAGRSTTDAHGQHYIDPRVGGGPGGGLDVPVPFDDFLDIPATPGARFTIPVLRNDWIPNRTESGLRIVSARVLQPLCKRFVKECDRCNFLERALTADDERDYCAGSVEITPGGELVYTTPLQGIVATARLQPVEAISSGPGWFASPRPSESVPALRGQLVESNVSVNVDDTVTYALIEYEVASASGRRSKARVLVQVLPPSPDGTPVQGPYHGGPFQAPRPYDLGLTATWDERPVFPAYAPLSHYLPGRVGSQQALRAPLTVRWLGGYGYDCRASYAHNQPMWPIMVDREEPSGRPVTLDLCTGTSDSTWWNNSREAPIKGPRIFSYAEGLRRFPDAIPDTLWVDRGSRHDGSRRPANYVAIEDGIRAWTAAGANESSGPMFFNEDLPGTTPPLVTMNRTYVSCPTATCYGMGRSRPAFAGTMCPAVGDDVNWPALRAEAASLTNRSDLLLVAEIPYNPAPSFPGFESGPCGAVRFELPVPCDSFQDYEAWHMGGAIATFRVRDGLPRIFNNWVSNAGYFAEGMMDPLYMHPAKTWDVVGCMGGGSFGGCSFGTFGGGTDDTGLVPCNLARGQMMYGPLQPGRSAYEGRIRAFPKYRRMTPDSRYPATHQTCYDIIRLAAQGGGVAVACQANDGLEHGSIFVRFDAACASVMR